MNIEELFAGVGLVIDDHVFDDTTDKIKDIVADLESRKIPLAKYTSVPDISGDNCKSFSFALIDWELISVEDEDGYPISGAAEAKGQELKKLLVLLKDVFSKCYLPVFIFSNLISDDIRSRLVKEGFDLDRVPIFIKNKSEIITEDGSQVWPTIEMWIRNTPSLYVYKVWQEACNHAGVSLMNDLSIFKGWTKIIWESSAYDSTEPCEEMADIITRNVFARMQPLVFDSAIVNNDSINNPSVGELQNVLSAQRYTTQVNKDVSLTGDFFKCPGGKYYLNIRPACDCVCRTDQEPQVYLIRGSKLSQGQRNEKYNRKNGNFDEQCNEAIVGPIDKDYFTFRFQDLTIESINVVKEYKIGRILPPFITHVTEKYGLYIQRQGLPRLPKKAVLTPEQIEEEENQDSEEG